MILKGNQRGGATAMGLHLLRTDDNDHVEVHQIRGFVARNVVDALREAYAISRGTQCRQFIFSMSASPPESAVVSNTVFEQAFDEVELSLGLAGQPRIIVFHEKNGRRHAHCVWSRIDGSAMKAINLPHYKFRLQDQSRKLYMEYGWRMPEGLLSHTERDPFSFSREEWQQARRAKQDARELKVIFKECWAISDDGRAFQQAIRARGFYLAKGDRRGYVAVDWQGEVYSISRWAEIPTGCVADRLRSCHDISTVDQVKRDLADRITTRFGAFAGAASGVYSAERDRLLRERERMVVRQRADRTKLRAEHDAARQLLVLQCATRFRSGLRGFWDRLSGRHRAIRLANAKQMSTFDDEAALTQLCLRERHLSERRELQSRMKAERVHHRRYIEDLKIELLEATAALQEGRPPPQHDKSGPKPNRKRGPTLER